MREAGRPGAGRPGAAPGQVGDAGLTLTEMTVAMSVFGAVLALFIGSMSTFIGLATRTVTITSQDSDAQAVYNLFDRSVRSATSINRPQRVGNNWYVEWLGSASSPSLCTQWVLRTDTATLAVRTWVPVATGTTTPSAWRTVATDIVNTSTQQPFVLTPATLTVPIQRFGINLWFRRSTTAAATATSTSFVALNSGLDSVSNPDVNADGVSDKEVCTDISARRP